MGEPTGIEGTAQTVEVSLPLEPSHAPSRAELQVRPLSSHRRALRAGLAWGLCWAIALAFLPVPIVHFILVPAFLITGPVVAWKRFSKTVVVERGTLQCIRCRAPVPIEEPHFGWPVGLFCKACGVTLRLQPPAAA